MRITAINVDSHEPHTVDALDADRHGRVHYVRFGIAGIYAVDRNGWLHPEHVRRRRTRWRLLAYWHHDPGGLRRFRAYDEFPPIFPV